MLHLGIIILVSTQKFCNPRVLTSETNPIAIAIKSQPLLRCNYDHTQIFSISQTLLFLQFYNVSISNINVIARSFGLLRRY